MGVEPLVSILIPCLNAEPMLELCLGSVLAQSHPNVEVILVDNGSTDASMAVAARILARHGGRAEIAQCATRGANFARQMAYGMARGDYIQWLDADDTMDPAKIALQVAALERSPDVDIAYGDVVVRMYRGGAFHRDIPLPVGPYDDHLLRLLEDIWLPPVAHLVRRAAADKLYEIEAWSPVPPASQEDREYFSMAAVLGCRFDYVPGSLSHYSQWGGPQVTSSFGSDVRTRTRARIFRRLRAVAAEQPPGRIKPEHQFLLDLSADAWTVSQEDLEITKEGDRVRARNNKTGKSMLLTEDEAMALSDMSGTMSLEHHANSIHWRRTARRYPAPHGQFFDVLPAFPRMELGEMSSLLRTLHRFCEGGLLVPAAGEG